MIRIFLLSLLICFSLKANFDEVIAVQNAGNHNQIIIGCCDDHTNCKDTTIAPAQQNDVITYAQKQIELGKTVHIIGEDLCDYKGDKKKLIEAYNNSPATLCPLINLNKACRAKNISCADVEFRHVNIMIDQIIKQMRNPCEQELHKILSTFDLTFDDMLNLEATYKMLQEVQTYDDPILESQYQNILCEVLMKLKEIESLRTKLLSAIAENWLDLICQFIAKVKLADAQLLNARILHEMYVHKDKDIVIICAGFEHMKKVKEALLSLKCTTIKISQKTRLDYIVDSQSGKTFLKPENCVNVREFFDELDHEIAADQRAENVAKQEVQKLRNQLFFYKFCTFAGAAALGIIGAVWFKNRKK